MGFEPETEEADVARVEEILDAVASNPGPTMPQSDTRPVATHALCFCACVSEDAPTWLIYVTPDNALVWQRVPDGADDSDLVDAQRSAGGHVSPDEVLSWLEGEKDPWSSTSDIFGDPTVLPELGRRIRGF